jgi:uncharacterized protein DUF1918
VEAKVGDRIVVESERVGQPVREGVVLGSSRRSPASTTGSVGLTTSGHTFGRSSGRRFGFRPRQRRGDPAPERPAPADTDPEKAGTRLARPSLPDADRRLLME